VEGPVASERKKRVKTINKLYKQAIKNSYKIVVYYTAD
jgi:hypothetical protein